MHALLAFLRGLLVSTRAPQYRVMYCHNRITMQGTLADCQRYIAIYGNDRGNYRIVPA